MREIVLRGRGPNTMSLAMLSALERELDAAGDAPLLVTGEGSAFSAGLDLDELARADASHVAELLAAMERTTRKLFLHPAPTVALVNGHAIAGGCLLAQCCDHRVAPREPRIRIGMTGVAIGLVYPPFVMAVFRQRVPLASVERVLLSAARFSPDEALALGLLDELSDAPRARAEAVIAERAALPSHAHAAAKRALRAPAMRAALADGEAFAREVLPSWTRTLAR